MGFDDWAKLVKGPDSEIKEKLLEGAKFVRGPTKEELGGVAWTINPFELAGDLVLPNLLPMEGHNITGYVIKKAGELDIPTPTNNYLYPLMFDVVHRRIEPHVKYLEMVVAATNKYYL